MWSLGFLLPFLTGQPMVQSDSKGAWCYDSQDPKCGPTHWKELTPACGGPAQSPINIDLHLVQKDSTLVPFIFQGYDSAPPGPWTLENDGHTVLLRLNPGPQSFLVIGGAGLPSPQYQLLQLHFHWGGPGRTGSEHSLDGWRSSMEMHMVHLNTKYQRMEEARSHPDGLAVLAVLLVDSVDMGPMRRHHSVDLQEEQDKDNANFSAIVSGLKNVSLPGDSVNLTSTFPLASLLPNASGLSHYYRYSGSLTTPGCEPAVLWTVFENAVPIGRSQPLAGRRIFASPGASIRAAAPPLTPTLTGLHWALLGLGLGPVLWQGP